MWCTGMISIAMAWPVELAGTVIRPAQASRRGSGSQGSAVRTYGQLEVECGPCLVTGEESGDEDDRAWKWVGIELADTSSRSIRDESMTTIVSDAEER